MGKSFVFYVSFKLVFNIDLDDCEEYYGELFRRNFIPYIGMRIVDHHELHALAVRLGMNEFKFTSVLGKVSNNLLTKSQVILENWRNSHADIAEVDLLKQLELVFTSMRRHDLAHSIKVTRKCVAKKQ